MTPTIAACVISAAGMLLVAWQAKKAADRITEAAQTFTRLNDTPRVGDPHFPPQTSGSQNDPETRNT